MIAVAFVIAGVLSFCSLWWTPPDPNARTKHRVGGIMGSIFGLGVGGMLGFFLLRSPTPAQRQQILDHVLRTPSEQIVRVVIQGDDDANQYRPLTHTDVVIDDRARIRKIAETLQAASEVSPNHPRTRWSANVRLVTPDGTWHFGVTATEPGDSNGTLVRPWSSADGGWNLGSVRADGLEKLFEEAVAKAKEIRSGAGRSG